MVTFSTIIIGNRYLLRNPQLTSIPPVYRDKTVAVTRYFNDVVCAIMTPDGKEWYCRYDTLEEPGGPW
jgi:hypothetical protein